MQDALKEQKDLENKIEKVNDSIEDLKKKSKEISWDIIELNKQILHKEKIETMTKAGKL